MALQLLESSKTEILPHKTLNNIDLMYHYLRQRLDSSLEITDLIPFIKMLTTMDDFKNQLKSLLDKHYKLIKSKQNKSDNKIRRLFISLFSLNGIPSDNIHAHILSYLPSSSYRKVAILSKHFRNILKNNQFIFNEKGYNVDLQFSTSNNKLTQSLKTQIRINHYSESICLSVFDPFNNKGNKIKHNQKHNKTLSKWNNPNNIDNLVIPINKLKIWTVSDDVMFDEKTDEDLILNDKHNKYILDYIAKYQRNVKKLCLIVRNGTIIEYIFNKNTFNECITLSIGDGVFGRNLNINIMELNTFKYLENIELNIGHLTKSLDDINNILRLTSNTLRCIKYKKRFTASRRNNIDNTETLIIPSNIEWLAISDGNMMIDMSECHKILGIKLLGIDKNCIIWPNNKEYIIPFICFGDKNGFWENMLFSKQLNVKFACLYKEKPEPRGVGMFQRFRYYQDRWQYNDDINNIKRVKMNDIKQENKDKCLILDKNDMNDNLIYKILKYSIKNEKERNMKLQQYKTWWKLYSALWIYNFGDTAL